MEPPFYLGFYFAKLKNPAPLTGTGFDAGLIANSIAAFKLGAQPNVVVVRLAGRYQPGV